MFSPDGQWLVSGSFDRTARLWRLPPPLGDADLETMRRRTWVAVGAALGSRGNVDAIPLHEWQRQREELRRRNVE